MRTARALCFALASAGLALAGCAHAPRASHEITFTWHPGLPPSTWFPLVVGSAWTYDVVDATGRHSQVINRVQYVKDGRAVFFEDPDPLAYEDKGDRILSFPSGKAVLEEPIQAGGHWALPGGGTARILAVDATISGAGQRITGCLRVEEADPLRRVVTTYAPYVGPVAVEIYSRDVNGGERLVTHAILQRYSAAPLSAQAP